jgi:hypothetical protein
MHYANKTFYVKISKILLKKYFVLQKCLSTVLNSSVEFYKILEIGLTEFEVFMQKL